MTKVLLIVTLFSAITFLHVKGKIIIDNDAGGDDAMAIFLALLYEKHFDGPNVIGLTTVNGNTNEDNVCLNNQRILKIARRQDVPIYRGSKRSLITTPYAVNYYGKDGLGDNEDDDLTNLVPAHTLGAVEALIEQSKIHEGNLTVVTIGTITNVALAIKLDPGFLGRLTQLYVGAGHIHNEDVSLPEFNAQMDVEAYHIVAEHANPDKVTVFPFSQTKAHLNFPREWRENVLGAIDTEIMRAQNKFERVSIPKNEMWASLDPSVLAVVLNPDLVEEYKYAKNGIILCGEDRGLNTNTFVEKHEANVRIVYSLKGEEYKQFLLEVFSADISKDNDINK